MKNKRGKNTSQTKHLGDKGDSFKSEYLDAERWILPLFLLNGLKERKPHFVDTYSLSQYFMREEIDELYEKISNDLHLYAKYVSEKESDKFLAFMTIGMQFFENPEIVESFYSEDNWSSFISKNGIDEYSVSKYLFRRGRKDINWYSLTLKHFKKLLPNHDIKLFIKLFAITSPQTHFKANVTNALKAYDLFKKNKPFSSKGFLPSIKNMLDEFKEGVFTFSGEERNGRRKVSNFARALLGDKNAVVVDSMVLKAFGLCEYYEFKGKVYSYSPRIKEYDLIERYIKLLARASNFEPRQVVSMLWAGTKKVNSKYKDTNTNSVLKDFVI